MRILLRHLRRVAEVEDGRALLRPLLAVVISAEQLVPEEAGDAVIAVLVVEMVGHVLALHLRQPLVLRLVAEVLDAVAEFVEAGGEEAGREGGGAAGEAVFGAPEAGDAPADRDGGDADRRQRRMKR